MTITVTDWRDLADGLVDVPDPAFPFDPAHRPPDYGIRHKIVEDLWPLAVPLDTLRLLPGNPRQGDVPAMRRSLATYGQRKPVVVNIEHGSRPVVEAGNHTMKAARAEGWTHLAVVRVRDDPSTELGYALADNRLGELGRFDPKLLAEATSRLEAADPALLFAAGYTGHVPPGVDPAEEWAGMPEFMQQDLKGHWHVVISFRTDPDVRAFLKLLGRRTAKPWPRQFWWPDQGGIAGNDPDYHGMDTAQAWVADDGAGAATDA